MSRDDDRPKKSWRDIDKQRDRSDHRGDSSRSPGNRGRSYNPSKSHRQNLDRLFNSGKVSELVRKRDEETGVKTDDEVAASRRRFGESVINAQDRDELAQAIEAYVEAFPSFPREYEVLTRFLEHPDPDIVTPTMDRLEEMLAEEKPRRTRTLIAQLRNIEDLSDYPALRKRAEALLDLL